MFKLFVVFTTLIVSIGLQAQEADYVKGEYLVKFKSSPNPSSLSIKSSKFYGAEEIAENVFLVKRATIEKPEWALELLSNEQNVEHVEQNQWIYINKVPNDPRYDDLWGLKNNKKKWGSSGEADIGVEEAWDITTGSKNVIVAVIDTGIDYEHSDLADNMWTNNKELNGVEGVDDDGNGLIDDVYGYDFANDDGDPMDDQSHGTHCAGTIGAKGNDGHGVVGVNWQVRLMALKFITKKGSGKLDGAIKSIDYAISMGAHLTNNSWGSYGESELLKEAIERTNKAGQLFIAAAGNDRKSTEKKPMYPASYEVENIISVAAISSSGSIARFSNYGQKVHLAAPGDRILSTTPSGFSYKSGTSMAAPHAAGVAALVWSAKPKKGHMEVKDALVNGTKVTKKLKKKVFTNGLLSAIGALTY